MQLFLDHLDLASDQSRATDRAGALWGIKLGQEGLRNSALVLLK